VAKTYQRPYAPPRKLERDLARVQLFWEGLKRRQATIPFWDDVHLSALSALADNVTMLDASEPPVRFRFALRLTGKEIKRAYGSVLDTKFLDEIKPRHPLEFLLSQCSATIESGAPTYYRHSGTSSRGSRAGRDYSRLVLPLWGEGRIGMLLVAFVFG
jgi:hypothetical protein